MEKETTEKSLGIKEPEQEKTQIEKDLQDLCLDKEKFTYQIPLSIEEINNLQDKYISLEIEIERHTKDLDSAKALHKSRVAPLEDEKMQLLTILKPKTQFVTAECYLIPNRITNEVEYKTATGEIVHTRQMTEKEKQININEQIAAGKLEEELPLETARQTEKEAEKTNKKASKQTKREQELKNDFNEKFNPAADDLF